MDKGQECNYRTLDSQSFANELNKKLHEEVAEYMEASSLGEAIEELADILEVIHAFATVHDVSIEDAEKARQKKAIERGGFTNRIFLIDVT